MIHFIIEGVLVVWILGLTRFVCLQENSFQALSKWVEALDKYIKKSK